MRQQLRPRGWKLADDWRAVPSRGGVYVIYAEGGPVYIGRSRNIRARLSSHKARFRDIAAFVKFSLDNSLGNNRALERKLIFRLRPAFNRQMPSCVGVSMAMYRNWR